MVNKPKKKPIDYDITKIRPMFYTNGGMAFCSCYKAIGGWKKFCPFFVKNGKDSFWCKIGGGKSSGDICEPFYRYLHQVGKIDDNLVRIHDRFWDNPEWHGAFIPGNKRWKSLPL